MRITSYRFAVLAAALTLSLMLSACGGGHAAIAQATAGLPPGASVVNGISVPPDPGPANDQTLAGIDTTGTGVRDDVYRALAVRYGTNQQIWRAALQDAKAVQLSVLANGDPSTSNLANDAQMAAGWCDGGVGFENQDWNHPQWMNMGNYILALTVDTPDRLSSFQKTEAVNTPNITIPPGGTCR